MESITAAALAALGFAGIIILLSIAGLLGGAIVGLIAGLIFPGTVGLVGSLITGGATMPAWQVGAVLGFVGAFFKTRLTTDKIG